MTLLRTGRRFAVLILIGFLAAGCFDKTVESQSAAPQGTATTAVATLAGAASTGNKSIRVTFSGAMGDSALDIANYSIVEDASGASGGTLTISSASFTGAAHDTVDIVTLSQNGVAYRLNANNIRDSANNPLAEPRTATFAGTPSDIADLVDSDGDGLYDNEEEAGWVATTLSVRGEATTRHVTSNPNDPDTDGDGLIDSYEKALGTDPRDSDSDDDGLSDYQEFSEIYSDPARQDTDGDTLADGREFNFFHTSPTQKDTDGDQIPDNEEVLLANRNARAADLPLPAIDVGDVDLRLDVRFSATSAQGTRVLDQKSASTTLVQTDNKSFSNTDSSTDEVTAKATIQGNYSAKVGGEGAGYSVGGSVEAGYSGQWTSSFTQTSSSESQKSVARTFSTDQEVTNQETVQRTIDRASMSVAVRIRSIGNIAFTIENLQVTALLQDPHDPQKLIPIATLVPDTSSGTPNRFSLGPLVPERGPFVFRNDQIFPALVQDLMLDPRGLVFKISNFDLTDEAGRNFAFTSQEINDRTTPLVIDYGGADSDGDGEGDKTDRYRVATSAGRPIEDTNGDGVIDSRDRREAFDSLGRAVGITVGEALEGVVGLKHYDEDANPASSLSPLEIENSYSTRVVNGVAVLWRVRGVSKELGNPLRQWEILTPRGIAPRDQDFRSHVIAPENGITLANIQDLDDDRIPARWEYIYGCSDTNTDTDGDGVSDYQEVFGGWQINVVGRAAYRAYSSCARTDSDRDGLTDAEEVNRTVGGAPAPTDPKSIDTDGDGVSDADEIRGYRIVSRVNPIAPGSGCVATTPPEMLCTSDPLNPDTDGDTLKDGDERTLGTDPTVSDGNRVFDDDGDGLSNFDEVSGWNVTFRRVSTVPNTEGAVVTCTPQLDNDPDCDGVNEPTSDPENPDTDGDGVPDGQERQLGLNPRKADTDGDGLPDRREVDGITGSCNGDPRTAATNPLDADSDNDLLSDGAEVSAWTDGSWVVRVVKGGVQQAPYSACPDPTNADADLDTLVDGQERTLSGPTDPNNFDTDGDGVSDAREIAPDRRTDPLVEDQLIDVRYTRIDTLGICDPGPLIDPGQEGEFQGTFWIQFGSYPDQVFSLQEGQAPLAYRSLGVGDAVTIPSDRGRRFIVHPGEFVRLYTQDMVECDAAICALSAVGNDPLASLDKSFSYPIANVTATFAHTCGSDPGLQSTYMLTVLP